MLRFLTSSIVFSGFWTPAPPLPLLVVSTLTDPVSTMTDPLSFILDPLLDLVRSSSFHLCSYVFNKRREWPHAERALISAFFRRANAKAKPAWNGLNTCIAPAFARPKNAKKFRLFCMLEERESPLGLGLTCDQAFYDFSWRRDEKNDIDI